MKWHITSDGPKEGKKVTHKKIQLKEDFKVGSEESNRVSCWLCESFVGLVTLS